MPRRKKTLDRKGEDWIKWKSSQLRSNWLARARKIGGASLLRTVPQPTTIRAWLRKNRPLRCFYTKKPLKEKEVAIDHKNPVSRGGTFSTRNLAITSSFMNMAKGNLNETEFKSLLKLLDTWEDKGYNLLSRLAASSRIFIRK